MNIIMNILNIPFSIVGYTMEFGWKFPKLFWNLTVNTYKYKTGVKNV